MSRCLSLAVAYSLGLIFDPLRNAFFRLGFDDPDRFLVNKEDIIGGSDVGLVFPDGDTQAGAQVKFLFILYDPPASGKLSVDIIPGQLFRRLIHDLSIPLMDVTPNNMKH